MMSYKSILWFMITAISVVPRRKFLHCNRGCCSSVIEVKTNFGRTTFPREYDKANKMGTFIMSNRDLEQIPTPLFNGIFYFSNQEVTSSEASIEQSLLRRQSGITDNDLLHLSCVNPSAFPIKYFINTGIVIMMVLSTSFTGLRTLLIRSLSPTY